MTNYSNNYKKSNRFKKLFIEANTHSFLSLSFGSFSWASPPSVSTYVKNQPLFPLVHFETLLWELYQCGIYLLLCFTPNLLHFFLSFLLNLNLVLNDLSFIFFPSKKNHILEIRKQIAYFYAVVSDLAGVARFLAYSAVGVPYPKVGWLLIIMYEVLLFFVSTSWHMLGCNLQLVTSFFRTITICPACRHKWLGEQDSPARWRHPCRTVLNQYLKC